MRDQGFTFDAGPTVITDAGLAGGACSRSAAASWRTTSR